MFRPVTAALFAAALGTTASATTYEYTSTNVNGVDSTYRFNDVTYDFKLSFAVESGNGVDGAWWVVNDGPMPQSGTRDKYAIFYTDMTQVWAYQYTGGFNKPQNNSGPLLQVWKNAVTKVTDDGKDTFSLHLELADLKARTDLGDEWVGLGFDEKIGTWLHPVVDAFGSCTGSYFDPNSDELNCFNGRKWIGWDEANRDATVVPIPATLPLLAAPLAGFAFGSWRRKRAQKNA
ncbi:MAG: hypothetical protein AAF871_12100 [Pseudomonadota bacterium]